MANLCGHKEAVCYGVEIPGIEGKAGMVAILGKGSSMYYVITLLGIFYPFPVLLIYIHRDLSGSTHVPIGF